MNITENDKQKALRIKRAIAAYFETSDNNRVPAKDLMWLFISKGIFTKDHREGLPIRDLLRSLDENNLLSLIPQVHFEQKAQNKNWFFIRSKK